MESIHHHHNHPHTRQWQAPRNAGCCCRCCCCAEYPHQPWMNGHLLQHHVQPLHSDIYPKYLKVHDHFHPPHNYKTQSVVSSLLHRIEALELSLSSASMSPCSLREAATRIIQTQFRAFLARRSRTLAQLKELAFIKSTVKSLKSSALTLGHRECQRISHRAMNLLLMLDSIQGTDEMIKDGKKVIKLELVRFLKFLDEISLRSHRDSKKTVNKVFRGCVNRCIHFDALSTGEELGLLNDDSDDQEIHGILLGSDHTRNRVGVMSELNPRSEAREKKLCKVLSTHNKVSSSEVTEDEQRFRVYCRGVMSEVSPQSEARERKLFKVLSSKVSSSEVSNKSIGITSEDEEEVDNGCKEVDARERNLQNSGNGGFTEGSTEMWTCLSPPIDNDGIKYRKGSALSAPLPLVMDSKADIFKHER